MRRFTQGHLCRPGDRLDRAWDDPVDAICNSTLYARAPVVILLHNAQPDGMRPGLRYQDRSRGKQ
jgi:hypothetical protein